MKKPMTTADLFNEIKTILKNKNMLPDILDYGIATSKPVPIRIYEFELKNNLDYGGSEGIYLDLWIEYYEDNEWLKSDIGTFKTLEDGREAMHAMAGLLADFIIEGTAYINANIDDFTWTGADVWAFDENGKRLDWCYSCSNMERAYLYEERGTMQAMRKKKMPVGNSGGCGKSEKGTACDPAVSHPQ